MFSNPSDRVEVAELFQSLGAPPDQIARAVRVTQNLQAEIHQTVTSARKTRLFLLLNYLATAACAVWLLIHR